MSRLSLVRLTRSVGGVVLGYATLVVLITVALGALGDPSWGDGDPTRLFLGGAAVFVCAVAASLVAWAIAGRAPVGHACVLIGLATIETTVLLTTEAGNAPLWFELLGAGNMLAGLLAGGMIGRLLQAKRAPAVA